MANDVAWPPTVFPNLAPEPQDCLMYGKAVR